MTYDTPDWLNSMVIMDPTTVPPSPIIPGQPPPLSQVYEQGFTHTNVSGDQNLAGVFNTTSFIYFAELSVVVWSFTDTGSDVLRFALQSQFGSETYAVVQIGIATLPTSGMLPFAQASNTFGAAAPVLEVPLKITSSTTGGTGAGPTYSAAVRVAIGYIA